MTQFEAWHRWFSLAREPLRATITTRDSDLEAARASYPNPCTYERNKCVIKEKMSICKCGVVNK